MPKNIDGLNVIDERYPYGQHIDLTCRNHPEMRWSTKNIDYIGARSIFYNLHRIEGMGAECNCRVTDLIIVP